MKRRGNPIRTLFLVFFVLPGVAITALMADEKATAAQASEPKPDAGQKTNREPLRLRVATAQISVTRDIAANVKTINRAIDRAVAEKADILLTPEGSLSGYTHQFEQSQVEEALNPHLSQKLSEMGARIIFQAINGGRNGSDWSRNVYWPFHETNLRLRARTGKLWIVTADNCHPTNIPCSAPSGVLRPDGQWAIQTPNQGEHIVTYTIELD